MKVCIVTVYDSINSGSYWQAYALGHVLEELGNEVFYYKRKKRGASSSVLEIIKQIGIRIKNDDLKRAISYFVQTKKFKDAVKVFDVIGTCNKNLGDIDVFILGSDTIWNIEDKYFRKFKNVFWGDVFKDRTVVSYATSIGNTSISMFNPIEKYLDSLNRIKLISVRDEYTKEVITKITHERRPSLVCDPTLLLDSVYYHKIATIPETEGDYIFLYLFNPLNKVQSISLREFANNRKLKVIYGTDKCIIPYLGKVVINSPQTFIDYMVGAKYVITDTYHGTVFSVNLNKSFIVINREKNKVNEFLSWVGLEDRLLSKDRNIANIIENDIDYNSVNKRIKDLRNYSLSFIEDILDNKVKHNGKE